METVFIDQRTCISLWNIDRNISLRLCGGCFWPGGDYQAVYILKRKLGSKVNSCFWPPQYFGDQHIQFSDLDLCSVVLTYHINLLECPCPPAAPPAPSQKDLFGCMLLLYQCKAHPLLCHTVCAWVLIFILCGFNSLMQGPKKTNKSKIVFLT